MHRLLEAMLPCGYHCATDLYPVDRATVRIVLSCRLCRADPYGVFSVAMGGRPPSASAIIRLTVGVGCALQPVCILAATECHCQSCYRVSCGGGWAGGGCFPAEPTAVFAKELGVGNSPFAIRQPQGVISVLCL